MIQAELLRMLDAAAKRNLVSCSRDEDHHIILLSIMLRKAQTTPWKTSSIICATAALVSQVISISSFPSAWLLQQQKAFMPCMLHCPTRIVSVSLTIWQILKFLTCRIHGLASAKSQSAHKQGKKASSLSAPQTVQSLHDGAAHSSSSSQALRPSKWCALWMSP